MDKKRKIFKQVLFETIDQYVEDLDVKKVTSRQLNELFTLNPDVFIKKMSGQDIDSDGEIDTELWDWFLDTINESIVETPDAWRELLHDQKLKILCYKYFTKRELLKNEKIEPNLKKDIKKYFSSLQNYSDLKSFQEKVKHLPSDILTNLIRFLFLKLPELKDKIKVTKEEFKERIVELKSERMKMADKLSMISKKYQTVLDISKLKELYNNGVFFEDSLINRAINEYIVKLLNYEESLKAAKELYPSALLNDLKYQAENSIAYTKHIEEVTKEETEQFFTDKGYQIGNRFQSAIQDVKKKEYEDQVINKDSIFKEPVGSIVKEPWTNNDLGADDTETDTAGGDSSFSGGGGGGFSGGGGGGISMAGADGLDEPSPENAVGADAPDTSGEAIPIEDLENDTSAPDSETELPKDEEGFPVDFGSQETNPDATKEKK